jgi:DNA-binding transcriptional LysR family regulator
VAPTETGEQFIARLGRALADVRGALDQVAGLRDKPAGRVRLVASRMAARMVLAPKLAEFARNYPDVVLDLTTTEESRLDLVGAGFDAGIHLGEFIERDMVAVRVSKDQRAASVGAPSYFASHPRPRSPHDLTAHRCIDFRHGSSGVYHWEFEKGRKSLSVAVKGPVIVDDVEVLLHAANEGVGLAFTLEEHVAPHLASGALVRVLERGPLLDIGDSDVRTRFAPRVLRQRLRSRHGQLIDVLGVSAMSVKYAATTTATNVR